MEGKSEINKELTESPNIQIRMRIQAQSCRLSQLLSVSDRRFVAAHISHIFSLPITLEKSVTPTCILKTILNK